MMMQYIYYGALQRSKARILKLKSKHRHHHHHHHQQHSQEQHQGFEQQGDASSSCDHLPPHLLQSGFTAAAPGSSRLPNISTPVAAALSITALLCCSMLMMSWQVSGPTSGSSSSSSSSSSRSEGSLMNKSRHMAGAEGSMATMMGKHGILSDDDWML
jgi:hypothetical protein